MRIKPRIRPTMELLEPRMMLSGPGTQLSVQLISDIDPTIPNGRGGTTSLTAIEGRMYFPGQGENGIELYAYDPLTDSTFEVADINPTGDSNPGHWTGIFVFHNRLFFDAVGSDGSELHVFDPATGIVSQIEDINPDGDSYPLFAEIIDGRLLFRATGPNGTELYEYDPAATGNPLTEFDINESGSSLPNSFNIFDDRVFFRATGPLGEELYVYDPVTRDVALVADINPSTVHSNVAQFFQPFDGKLFFRARGANGDELFALDPETDQVIDFDVNPDGDLAPLGSTPFGNQLYFSGYSFSPFERNVYSYDADTDSIELMTSNFWANGFGFGGATAVYQDRLFFDAQGNDAFSTGIYSYDSEGELDQLVDPLLEGLSYAKGYQVFDDKLFFTATDANREEELYAYDGNTGSLTKFDLNPDGGSNPLPFGGLVFEGLLLYRATGPNGTEIYAYDRATETVAEVADINPDGDAFPWRFTRLDNRLFFVAKSSAGPRIFALERQLPPVANHDDAMTGEDHAVDIYVLANDSDPNGDPLSTTAVTQPANGVVAINASGTLAYTPDVDFHGTDSFQYTIDDGHCGTATATVTVTVVASEQQIPILVDEVETLGNSGVLNGGQVNALTTKLDQALRDLGRGRLDATIRHLRAFAHQIDAYRKAGILRDAQADALLEETATLIVSIGFGEDSSTRHALESAVKDKVFADIAILQSIL